MITSILNKGNFTWALIVFPLGATLGQVPIYTLLVELLFQSQKYFVSANVYPLPLHSDKPKDSLNPCSALPYHLFFKGMKGKGFFLLVQKSLDHLPLKKSLFDEVLCLLITAHLSPFVCDSSLIKLRSRFFPNQDLQIYANQYLVAWFEMQDSSPRFSSSTWVCFLEDHNVSQLA